MGKITVEKIEKIFQNRQPQIVGSKLFFSVFVPVIEKEGDLYLLYELRAETLNRQPGEVCFPGGEMEENESREQCAVRETVEELGVDYEDIKVLAQLDTVYNYNNITMYCFIGTIPYEKIKSANINRDEVAEIFMVPLDYLAEKEPEIHYAEIKPAPNQDFPYDKIGFERGYDWKIGKVEVPIYLYEDKVIWGLTGRITNNLVKLLAEEEDEF